MSDEPAQVEAEAPPARKQRRLTPLRQPPTLAARATDVIREQILSGRWEGGERLVETTLARELGVSRGPIREAFAQLTAEGLVESGPRVGVTVVHLDPSDVTDIYELRIALETLSVRSIARDRESHVRALSSLRTLIERMRRAAIGGDTSAVVSTDLKFHGELCRMSGNRRVHEAFLYHTAILERILRLDAQHGESDLDIVEEHETLLNTLMDPIADGEAAIERHLSEALTRILDRLPPRVEREPVASTTLI
jgi:DNA-binding GntR family transcriptional regulator